MKFLTGKPACVVDKKLILAELHFGIELSLQQRGVNVQLESKKYSDSLNKLKAESKTTELVVIGDFKHTVTGFDQRERNAFNEFIHELEFEKITVVKGNHDSRLEEMAKPFPHFTVEPATGMTFQHRGTSFGLFHGHANASEQVMKADVLMTGHNHAGIQIGSGEFGKTLPAWIIAPFGKKQKLIVFPSFNPLSGSVPFNALKPRELHGPIFKTGEVKLEEAEVILLSGQRIGKLKHLRIE
ncbi:MAG: metallophosphoesterase family protein [Candidatus Micrarchaeota archaeon]|nr:metallophosphoesterase family protein [Candidatus Micrarchaeota archaeon]